jgi:DNA-binding PadR family transcriptional regulator
MASSKRSEAQPPPVVRDLELIVLLAALHLGDEAYPAAIRDVIEQRTRKRVSRPAVFITLERLERKGLMSSRYGDPTPVRGGRAKRFFRVERRGLAAARASLDVVTSLTSGLETILETR